MYFYVVRISSAPWKKFLESIFRFLHLLIMGLIKGFSPNLAYFSTSSTEMYHHVVHKGSVSWGYF